MSSLLPGLAQGSVSRLGGDLRTASTVVLAASKPPAMAARLLGAPDASLRLERMILLLEPSAEQQQALTAELVALQNPASAEYHRWLSPSAFADAYANSAADVAAIASWLTGQGFAVAPLPASRGWIEFSGTAQQVEQAFGATLSLASTPAGNRVVLTSAISVPSALAPLVRGLVSLDGALSVPAMVTPRALALSAAELSAQSSLSQAATLTPRLMAAQLGLDALQATGSKGAGQTIGLAARAFPAKDDLAAFRSAFGLPEGILNFSGAAIDAPSADDRALATLMASWAGVAAPQAGVTLAAAASTSATDGLDLALAALVDQAQVQSLALGHSSCEAALSAAHQAFYAALYRQAAAEGIAVISAAGDSGAAACFKAGSEEPVTTGLAVNALASTPWNMAVGASALTAEGAPTAWAPVNPADPAYAGGGGVSTLYPRPSWQSTATAAGFRVLPDLALPTALDSASSHGVVLCLGSASSTACTPYRTGGSAAASALMAGLSVLATEKSGSLGNLATALYNTSTGAAAYQDIQQGTAQLACTAASSACDSTGHIGYVAAQGFDQATGLGTAQATALVAQLARPLPNAATVTASVAMITGAQTVNPTASLTIVAQVTSSTGTAPTGTVQFLNATTGTVLAANATLSGTLATVTVNGGFAIGGNYIEAIYSGDATFISGTMAGVTITGKAGSTSLALVTTPTSPYAGVASTATGTVSVTDYQGSAVPAGSVSLSVDGVAVTAQSINSSGVASFSLAALAAGQHTLQGTYLTSNTNYSNSQQTTATVTVQKNAGPTLALPAGLSGSSGSTITIPVSVSSSSAAASAGIYPSGTLTLKLDGNQLTTQTFTASSASTTISVPITLSAATGSRTLSVSYDGDNYYSTSSTSAALTVSKAVPTVTAAWPANLLSGYPITVTSTVTGSNGTAPTGSVTFIVDGVSQAAQSLNTASATTATATLSVSGLSSGTHTLSATYSGDTNYTTGTSSTVSATTTLAPTVTTLTASPDVMARNTTETFTATVAPASAVSGTTYTLTGNVKFYDGTTLLGTVTVSGNRAILSGVSLATNVSHSITAVYSGDTTWATSTSSALVLAPLASSVNVVLTSNLTLVPVGRALVLTVTVTPAIGTTAPNNPTGSVVFYEGTNIIGQAALVPTANSNSSVATLTLQVGSGGNWSGGTHTIFASYAGDTNYDAATSNLLTLTVQDFTLTLNPTNPATNIDIVKGGAGTASINIKGWGGFNGLVQLTCAPTISVYLTCSASPQQINPTADVSFVVQTYTTGGITTVSNHMPGWPQALGGTALAGLFFLLLPFGRRARTFVNLGTRRFLIFVLLLAGLATAGIGCNQVTAVTAQGTPLGAYTMKVTGVAYVDNTVVNRTVNFTVNVYQK